MSGSEPGVEINIINESEASNLKIELNDIKSFEEFNRILI